MQLPRFIGCARSACAMKARRARTKGAGGDLKFEQVGGTECPFNTGFSCDRDRERAGVRRLRQDPRAFPRGPSGRLLQPALECTVDGTCRTTADDGGLAGGSLLTQARLAKAMRQWDAGIVAKLTPKNVEREVTNQPRSTQRSKSCVGRPGNCREPMQLQASLGAREARAR